MKKYNNLVKTGKDNTDAISQYIVRYQDNNVLFVVYGTKLVRIHSKAT